MIAIEWSLSPDMRSQVEPHLEYALAYAPAWIQSLCVRYSPDEEHIARIHVQPEYRFASLIVGDQWFAEPEAERRIACVHEVLHMHTQGLNAVLDDLLDAVSPDEALAKWAREQWRRAEEGMICDLSRRLVK